MVSRCAGHTESTTGDMDEFWKGNVELDLLFNCKTGGKLRLLPANGLMPFMGSESRRQSSEFTLWFCSTVMQRSQRVL